MKIVYHHRTLGDGAEGVHIHSMIAAFEALGHRVSVDSLAKPAGSGRGDPGVLAALRHRLPQPLFEIGTLAANAVEFALMRQKLRAVKPSFLYKRHALFDFGTALAAAQLRVPLVLEVNRLYASQTMERFEPLSFRRLARRLERWVMRSARVVIAVSTPLRNQIERLAGSDVRVIVLPNGADPELFDPGRVDGSAVRSRYGLGDRFIVGWVGVLRAWHGLDLLLRAVQRIREGSVLIVGDGPGRGDVERLAKHLGMSERVVITGRVDHRDVPEHIAAFDIAVSPDDRTGFASPMKVIEYMAMARPVVVPRLENFLDIVVEGRTGLVFRSSDSADLANQIAELHENARLRRELGECARHEVLNRLNWEQNARTVLEVVQDTVGKDSTSQSTAVTPP